MTNNIQATTIRPGILVALRTSVTGNVKYAKRVINAGTVNPETGEHVAEWETIRTIVDRDEHDRAVKVRSEARTCLTKVCVSSAFGLLCPEADSPDLVLAIAKAKRLCADFNVSSKVTTVSFNALMGRVAQDDVEAIKAINAEVRDLISDMKDGIENIDAASIRIAASKLKQLIPMLAPDAQARANPAIEVARAFATKVVAAGETAGFTIDQRTLRTLAEARTAFLDLEGGADVATPAAVGARAVDLDPSQ